MHRLGYVATIGWLLVAAPLQVVGDTVAARVNGDPVTAAEVESELRLAQAEPPPDGPARARLFRSALDQVIDRRLVLNYLTHAGNAASDHDVNRALTSFEAELKAQNLTLTQHCERVGLSKDDVRRSLAWRLSWKRYCEQQLSPSNLEKYFQRYRRDFDGTQVRVAQILLKVPESDDESALAAVEQRARELRSEIATGKITFEAAARRDSAAPSGSAGGDIGWIERRRPMPEDFSRVAFSLKKGEVSGPLKTPFGVHLLTVLDEKPGTLAWQDVESELRPAVTLYLFRWIADKERQTAKIEYLQDPN